MLGILGFKVERTVVVSRLLMLCAVCEQLIRYLDLIAIMAMF